LNELSIIILLGKPAIYTQLEAILIAVNHDPLPWISK